MQRTLYAEKISGQKEIKCIIFIKTLITTEIFPRWDVTVVVVGDMGQEELNVRVGLRFSLDDIPLKCYWFMLTYHADCKKRALFLNTVSFT